MIAASWPLLVAMGCGIVAIKACGWWFAREVRDWQDEMRLDGLVMEFPPERDRHEPDSGEP